MPSNTFTGGKNDTLQVEPNPKRQRKHFLLQAYVLFIRVSGDLGSGKWLFIHPPSKMSSFVWILWSFGGDNWRVGWCFVIHIILHLCISLISRDGSLHLPLFVFSPGDMLDLLKWRAHPERINDSLSKLKEIDGSEIVKVGARKNDSLGLICSRYPGICSIDCFWFDFNSLLKVSLSF